MGRSAGKLGGDLSIHGTDDGVDHPASGACGGGCGLDFLPGKCNHRLSKRHFLSDGRGYQHLPALAGPLADGAPSHHAFGRTPAGCNRARAVKAGIPGGSVKAPGVANLPSYACITYDETPHPPPCGPPSPQGRGIEIRITTLNRGERGDRKAVGEGSFRRPSDFDETPGFTPPHGAAKWRHKAAATILSDSPPGPRDQKGSLISRYAA